MIIKEFCELASVQKDAYSKALADFMFIQIAENIGVTTAYIEPGIPWENGYFESFNTRMRDEFSNGELPGSLRESEVLPKRWQVHYTTIRPHSAIKGKMFIRILVLLIILCYAARVYGRHT